MSGRLDWQFTLTNYPDGEIEKYSAAKTLQAFLGKFYWVQPMITRRIFVTTLFLLTATLVSFLAMDGAPSPRIERSDADIPINSFTGRLYQREASSWGSQIAQAVLVGDVMLGRGVAGRPDVFEYVAEELIHAPLLVGNLEGALVAESSSFNISEGKPEDHHLLLFPSAFALLQRAGFDMMSVANNHIYDGGQTGKARTEIYLRRYGITPLGVHPQQIAFRTINGVRLAFLAYNAVAIPAGHEYLWRKQDAIQTVHRARNSADAVIVLMHWGDEFASRASPRQRQAALELIEAGADLVVGHHPHVLQETQVIQASDGRPGFVAYSLGNFVFDQYDEGSRMGAALRVLVDRQGLLLVEGIPAQPGVLPRWLTGENAEAVLGKIQPQPLRLAFRCNHTGCEETEATQRFTGGEFWNGSIDLTGDGIAERVELRNERLLLFEGQRKVWQSPPEWRVLDAAMGDPNLDGRNEIIIALEKPDRDGVMRSHPFIIGFRGGVYRDVWGGSAVADRIAEVELADIDQDGEEELIVIEEKCTHDGLKNFDGEVPCKRAIAVWDWNGWGFSLFWRSFSDRYQNLSLCHAPGAVLLLCVERLW